jgi:hypothetical protein
LLFDDCCDKKKSNVETQNECGDDVVVYSVVCLSVVRDIRTAPRVIFCDVNSVCHTFKARHPERARDSLLASRAR